MLIDIMTAPPEPVHYTFEDNKCDQTYGRSAALIQTDGNARVANLYGATSRLHNTSDASTF